MFCYFVSEGNSLTVLTCLLVSQSKQWSGREESASSSATP